MMVLINMDFWGDDDELKKLDKAYENMAKKSDEMEYLGRFSPNTKKFHWTYFLKVKDYSAWEEGFYKQIVSEYKRDLKVMSHAVVDFHR